MSFTQFAFGTFALTALIAGCAGNAGTDPVGSPEPASSTSEAVTGYRAQCNQRCQAAYDDYSAACAGDSLCLCSADQEQAACTAACSGRILPAQPPCQ